MTRAKRVDSHDGCNLEAAIVEEHKAKVDRGIGLNQLSSVHLSWEG